MSWLVEAEIKIRETFPVSDFAFEPLDAGRQLGVCVRKDNFRRAKRLGENQDWLAEVRLLINEVE